MLGGLVKRLKTGLDKTRSVLTARIAAIVSGGKGGALDEDALDEIEAVLIQADLGVDVATEVMDALREKQNRLQGQLATSDVIPALKEELLRLGNTADKGLAMESPLPAKPFVILVVGINGVGKTTMVGKLAKRYVDKGYKVAVAACDTFRAAAVPQLEIWAQRAGVEIIRSQQGADPASVAFDAISAAHARDLDVILVDTAGRLHNKVNLMEELKKIRRVLGKQDPRAPHETLLVLDATSGQNALVQAREFNRATPLTGLALTKLDGTAKGGLALALRRELGIPVKLIGIGEGLDDLQPFEQIAFVDALLGD